MTSSASIADSLPYVIRRETNVMPLSIIADWIIDKSRPYLVATADASRDDESGYVGVAVKIDAYSEHECIGTFHACTLQCSPDEHLTIRDAETMGIRKALCILCTRDLADNYTQCLLHSDSKHSLDYPTDVLVELVAICKIKYGDHVCIQWLSRKDKLLKWVHEAAYATRTIGNDAVQLQQSLAGVGNPGIVRFERSEAS